MPLNPKAVSEIKTFAERIRGARKAAVEAAQSTAVPHRTAMSQLLEATSDPGELERIKRAIASGRSQIGYHGTIHEYPTIDPSKVDLGIHLGTPEQASIRLQNVIREKGLPGFYPPGSDKPVAHDAQIMALAFDPGKVLEMKRDVGSWHDAVSVLSHMYNRMPTEALNREVSAMLEYYDPAKEYHIAGMQHGDPEWHQTDTNRQALDEIRDVLTREGYGSIRYPNEVENVGGHIASMRPEAEYEASELVNLIGQMHREAKARMPARLKAPHPGDPDVQAKLEAYLNQKVPDPINFMEPEERNLYDEMKARLDLLTNDPQFRGDAYSHIILDPSRVRSINAQFDPEHAQSPDLMKAKGGSVSLDDMAAKYGKGGPVFRDVAGAAQKLAKAAAEMTAPVKPSALDMSHEARMQRAKEQGFNIDRPLYHGGASDFDAINIGRRGFYATDNPDIAGIYAEMAERRRPDVSNASPNIMPFYLRGDTLKVSDRKPAGGGWLIDNLAEALGVDLSNIPTKEKGQYLRDVAKERGFSAIEITDMDDRGGRQSQIVVIDPAQARSVNAEFNPEYAESPELMKASGGPVHDDDYGYEFEPDGDDALHLAKGGPVRQWLKGSVEKNLEQLKRKADDGKYGLRDYEAMLESHKKRIETPEPGSYEEAERNKYNRLISEMRPNAALNDWIDSALAKYVRRDLGAEHDPIAAIGAPHLPEGSLPWSEMAPHSSPVSRALQGGLGKDNPWLASLAPDEPVFHYFEPRRLGFDHIIDELHNAIRPDSDLPRELRLRPESLQRLSVRQASELVGKINEHRMRLKGASIPEADTFKEYPEGYRWVQLNRPGQFAAESDAMGHSVRGYEQDPALGGESTYGHGGWGAIQSGNAQIFSLRDKYGLPHATIEVESNQDAPLRGRMPAITQIKGKANAAPAEKYHPFIHDFISSRNWADIGDAENVGLRYYLDAMRAQEVKAMQDLGIETPSGNDYLTSQQVEELREKIRQKLQEREDRNIRPDYDEYKSGGAVKMKDGGEKGGSSLMGLLDNLPNPAALGVRGMDMIRHAAEPEFIKRNIGAFKAGIEAPWEIVDVPTSADQNDIDRYSAQMMPGLHANMLSLAGLLPEEYAPHLKEVGIRANQAYGRKLDQLLSQYGLPKYEELPFLEHAAAMLGQVMGSVPLSPETKGVGIMGRAAAAIPEYLGPFIKPSAGNYVGGTAGGIALEELLSLANKYQPTNDVKVPIGELPEWMPRSEVEQFSDFAVTKLQEQAERKRMQNKIVEQVRSRFGLAEGGPVKMQSGGKFGALLSGAERAAAKAKAAEKEAAKRTVKPKELGFDPRFDKRAKEQERLAESEFHYSGDNERTPTPISIFDLEGQPFITSMSDRTAAGRALTGIGDVNFDIPIDLHGGQDYMFNAPEVWAAAKPQASALVNTAGRLFRETGKHPLFLPYRMAPSSVDFSSMPADTMLAYARNSMTKRGMKQANKEIRAFFPEFLGIENPESMAQLANAKGDIRKAVLDVMDKGYRNEGALNIGMARLAVTDPKQFMAPDIGLQNVGLIDPNMPRRLQTDHPTYAAPVPGYGLGALKESNISAFDLLPAMVKERGVNIESPSTLDMYTLGRKQNYGVITDDILRAIDERLKKLRPHKDGGHADLADKYEAQ